MAAVEIADPSHEEPLDLRGSARQALRFERRFLRRRWAAYYAAWAFAIGIYVGVPIFLGGTVLAGASAPVRVATYGVLDALATLVAVPISVAVVSPAERTHDLRQAAFGLRSRSSPRTIAVLLAVLLAVLGLLVLSAFTSLPGYWTTEVPLLAFAVVTYRGLARSFRPIPFEGWIALGTFLAADLAALAFYHHPRVGDGALVVILLVWAGIAVAIRFGARSLRRSDG